MPAISKLRLGKGNGQRVLMAGNLANKSRHNSRKTIKDVLEFNRLVKAAEKFNGTYQTEKGKGLAKFLARQTKVKHPFPSAKRAKPKILTLAERRRKRAETLRKMRTAIGR